MSQALLIALVVAAAAACPLQMWWRNRRRRAPSGASGASSPETVGDLEALRARETQLTAQIVQLQVRAATPREARETTERSG